MKVISLQIVPIGLQNHKNSDIWAKSKQSEEESFWLLGENVSERTTSVLKEIMYLMSLKRSKETDVAGAE